MMPGMGHCGGGPGVNGFDQIGTLERWTGDPKDATNWSCRAPK